MAVGALPSARWRSAGLRLEGVQIKNLTRIELADLTPVTTVSISVFLVENMLF
jgi:hypothetical protein